MALSGKEKWDESAPVSFREWSGVLAAASLSAATRASHEDSIIRFLRHCKHLHAPASIILAKQYLAESDTQGANETREALRWFFMEARRAIAAVAPAVFPTHSGQKNASPNTRLRG